jgi:hypothetical protein
MRQKEEKLMTQDSKPGLTETKQLLLPYGLLKIFGELNK